MTEAIPFLVVALPRSRTHWLSWFLTYGDWTCWHEQFPRMRTLDDIKAWFSQNNTGTSETTAAPYWRIIKEVRPDVRTLIIRRPVNEVVDSLMRVDMQGVCTFDQAKLTAAMEKVGRKLDQIEARCSNVLSVSYADLASESVCARVFSHCLGQSLDHNWWVRMDAQNLQTSLPSLMRYMFANNEAIAKLGEVAKRHSLAGLHRRPPANRDDIVIQQESCEVWFRDGASLFQEHSVQLGEGPNGYLRKNWKLLHLMDQIGGLQIMTARCNGRMVGYYVVCIAPAIDDASVVSSLHISIFVSKDFQGIGGRLQRASLEALRQRGVGEICFRAGVNADGPRMGAIYKRAGAEPIGQMYRLDLRRA